ncbi:MAG: flagellar basal body P-ring formation protein FlgA [Rhodospirillales bacterium]|jgi:flagellar basal body P-ring formation protein FlgA|nr:flagellar basal body P-ring formation protein FlgA [Rhodospirillales bacterium]MBT4039425.1 flagellar basal body P-ring formation protein FlgA [Rhodospirillales bacterium]MBT4626567.1 flagellar basal body P-ring formation protein FlgA [Rhodospirillales bacterium]MBT5352441.1 flagellar basal body P-ring formation protein FlgA [Rhodospirillales bacterium]MBT5519348.1 flagellar basal body P-ring formation protein FlgA [Rhodospirillales bacterium]
MKSIFFIFCLLAGITLAPFALAHAADVVTGGETGGETADHIPQFGSTQVTGPVTLREAIYVDRDIIQLGDIFLNTGSLADKAVVYAPAPGDTTTYGAKWLARVARYYGLEWRPDTPRSEFQVVRESQVITHEEIMDAISFALLDYGLSSDMKAELISRDVRIYLPVNAIAEIAVESLRVDERANRFSVIIAAPAGDLSAKRVQLSGRIYQTMEVPFTTRAIQSGEVISERDIEWRRVRVSRISNDTMTSARDIFGKTPRRNLKIGDMIRASQIEAPVLVPRKSLVTVLLEHPFMTLTVQGRALESGSLGDVIRIKNNHSNVIVDAVVTGSGYAVVHISSQMAMN